MIGWLWLNAIASARLFFTIVVRHTHGIQWKIGIHFGLFRLVYLLTVCQNSKLKMAGC